MVFQIIFCVILKHLVYNTNFPQSYVGRLIGKKGSFVKRIKARTGANIIVHNHPNKRLRICALQGM